MSETDKEYRRRRYKELIGEKTWEAYDKEGRQSLEKREAKGIGSGEALQIIETELEQRRHKPISDGDEISPSYHPSRYQPSKSTFVGELKHLGREIRREVIEFPKRTLKGAAEDIETGRAYRESYRKHKSEAASSRGAGAEERHHRENVETETDQLKRKKALKDIEILEQKAYRVERAKIAARERSKLARQQRDIVTRPIRSQIVKMQPVSKPIVQIPLRQQYSSLDPYGLYSIRPNPNADTTWSSGRTSSANIFGVTGNPEAMYSLLGFNQPKPKTQSNKKRPEKSKSKAKRKRYNIFSGTWEEVE